MNPENNPPQPPTPEPPIPTEQPDAPQPYQPSEPVSQPVQPEAPAAQPQPPVQPVGPAPQPVQNNHEASKGLAIAAMVLGIVGLLTAWIGIGILLGLIGVILGIVSLVKHKGGKGLAIAGIITGGLAMVFGALLVAITFAAYSSIQERAKASADQSYANIVLKKAEAYNAENVTSTGGNYPTYEELLSSTGSSELDETAKSKLHEGGESTVSADKPIAYEFKCKQGAVISYWDSSTSSAKTIEAGYPTEC